jgi:hypothetical protein
VFGPWPLSRTGTTTRSPGRYEVLRVRTKAPDRLDLALQESLDALTPSKSALQYTHLQDSVRLIHLRDQRGQIAVGAIVSFIAE